MIDNISVTPGAGASVAANNVGGALYQRVKIGVGVADATPADLAFGAAAAASSLPVTQSTEDVARVGSLTETAPTTDTASSGLNGRLQRVAQRLSSLIGLVPTSLATGGGLRVTVQDTAGSALDYTVPALVGGDIAHDSPIGAQKPVVVGARAATALPTAVADADVTRLMASKYGELIARGVLEETLSDKSTPVTAGPTIIVTADASNKNRLYGLILANTNTTNPVKCELFDDTASRSIFQIPAGETRGFMVPPDAGMKQTTINKAWNLTITGTSSTVNATALFVKAGA